MATMKHSGSKRRYSWWWDSHISPKNSKWLQHNLQDMDSKVKAMIKLIEEDADTFSRRAEMYYKKRPELMKLVEEFYRAYRALAERYNNATGELRQAQKTMAAAFPNEFSLADDSRSESSVSEYEPQTPEIPHQIRAWLEESGSGISKKGLKQLNEFFESENSSPDYAINTEIDLENLKKTLAEIQAEKESVFIQYQQSLEKLSNLERDLSNSQKNAVSLDERASNAETELTLLKEALRKLESERDTLIHQNDNSLEKISTMEVLISQAQEDAKGLDERAKNAETKAENLKNELSRLEEEKESGLREYKQCLEIISSLENKISLADENSRMLAEQTNRAESEIEVLKQAVAMLTEEKEAACRQYNQCLEIIAKLESEIYHALEDNKRLNSEILARNEKLKSMDEQCIEFERSNKFLQIEAENLARQIAEKDRQLSDKQSELEKLQDSLQDENSRFLEAEATLQTLEKLHSQSQEEQRALTLELEDKFQILKSLEIRNNELEEENMQLYESSTISKQNLENEVFSLKELKEKLEKQVTLQMSRSNDLQQEVCQLRNEIDHMNRRYQALLDQVKSAGLNPECLHSSVKELQDETSLLIGRNTALEKLVSELNGKLEESKEHIKDMQNSRQYHHGEKSALFEEKTTLLSQLTIMTQNMQNVLEKNSSLENSFNDANIELERLREKSNSLEEFCQLLKSEKSNIVDERSFLISRLENVELILKNLELRFVKLEEKYTDLEKEKYSTLVQVEELRGTLTVEQQARANHELSSQSRMADIENHINILREENRSTKKKFDQELDKAVKAQVEIFVLQKFIEDLEEKNLSLLIECRKHVDESKLSDKLIAELESENLEQQVEAEFLCDEIGKLRMGIYQVFRALQLDSVNRQDNKIGQDEILLPRILDSIKDLKGSALSNTDEQHQMIIENSVLLSLLEQLGLERAELGSENNILDRELKTLMEQQCNLFEKNLHLNEAVEKLSSELNDARDVNDRLSCGISIEKEKAKEFLVAEEKLGATQILNAELCRTIGELSRDCRESKQIRETQETQIHEISENSKNQKLEIECLHKEKEKLESRLVELRKEIEEQWVREKNLCLELQERGDEFQVWEAEAASFYFDFQATTVNEVVLKNKIQELTTICENLEGSNAGKDATVEEMKGKVGVLESEIRGLKSHLSDYAPVIASLKDSITSLEHNAIRQRKFRVSDILEHTGEETACHETSNQDSKITGENDMTSVLLEMQTRIKAIEKAMVDEADRLAEEGSLKSIVKEEVILKQPEEQTPRRSISYHSKEMQLGSSTPDHLKLLKTRSKGSESRNRTMRDIPLDQVSSSLSVRRSRRKNSESSDDQEIGNPESAEKYYSHRRGVSGNITSRRFIDAKPKSQDLSSELQFEKELSIDKLEISSSIKERSKGRKKGLVLERLHSDAQRLTSLQTSVTNMKKSVEVKKRSKKNDDVEYKRVEWQLEELEDAVLQLIDVNKQLTTDIDPSTPVGKTSAELKMSGNNNTNGNKVLEQARKGSEKIGRLQIEVQSIQYLLMKLEDEKKAKAKSNFPGSRTGILLRDFIYTYSGRKSIKRRKKSRFCACVRPSTSNSSMGGN
ncbi:hypothetical protein ACFE04_016077 [Oxalis oulophora]